MNYANMQEFWTLMKIMELVNNTWEFLQIIVHNILEIYDLLYKQLTVIWTIVSNK